jgi:hypothetical protein
MHADVDEGAEVGDVGDHAFEDHSRLQVLDRLDAFPEVGGAELGTRVAARLFEFPEDVADGRQAELLVDVFLRRSALSRRASPITRDALLDVGEDTLDERVGFRVHRRAVERIVALVDAQEAGRQLEGLLAEARHFPERLPVAKGAVPVAVGDDVRRQRRAESGDARQQRRRGGVDVDADGVHAVLDDRVERLGQPGLADVVLVLADADRLRIDLDQFGERILQAAGDRHRAAQADVEFREFARGVFGGRIDRGAGFGDDDLAQCRSGCWRIRSATRRSVSREAVPLPMLIRSTWCLRASTARVCSAPSQSRRGSCG